MELTKTQALMVLEYFAAQAAEDAPAHDADKHMWMTRFQASLAIERQITEADWDALVGRMADLQSFDRDADAFLYQRGWDLLGEAHEFKDGLEDQVSFAIDNCWNNSGA